MPHLCPDSRTSAYTCSSPGPRRVHPAADQQAAGHRAALSSGATMKHVRVVALLGLGPRSSEFPHYTPVFYEDDAGARPPRKVPLPVLQAVYALLEADAEVRLVMLGTPQVRQKWSETGDLQRMLDEYLPTKVPLQFIEVPSGDPEVDQPSEASAAARFVDLLLPCLRRDPLADEAAAGWHRADQVVFDVTNGFRAQSVLSTTAIVAAVEEALRRGQEPSLRVQYGAYDHRKDGVAPVWDLTGMVTQQARVRSIDALVSNARADAFSALCQDLGAERIGTQYHDPVRRKEKQALRGLGTAAQTLADDLVCARTHAVLTSSAKRFCERLEAATPLIAAHAPAATRPLQRLADQARPLVCDLVVSRAGLHAQLALAQACVETERYAVATSILREMLVCAWHLETLGTGQPWQPGSKAQEGDAQWRQVEAGMKDPDFLLPEGTDPERTQRIQGAFRALGTLRNDVQHAGMRTSPLTSTKVRNNTKKKLQSCEALIRELYPAARAEESA